MAISFAVRALRARILFLLFAAFFLAASNPALAQFRASLQGTVTDTQGAVIPGAQVTLTDTQTGKILTTVSNGSGLYNFNALAPDNFTLTATMTGFTPNTIQNVRVIPEQPNDLNVQLHPGDTTTTVEVNGDTIAPLETATASIQGVVSSDQIQHLPSSNRDVFQLAQLAPGSFGDGGQAGQGGTHNLPGASGPGGSAGGQGIFQTENGPQIVSGGSQNENNSISIDGISTTSAVWGGTTIITPNEDSVDNVRIVSNGYDAELGRFSGAQLQVTSKSGSNQIHGSFFFRLNRPGLNAYQRYNGPTSLQPGGPVQRGLLRESDRFNQFGGSVGGPLWKDKLFAFFAYESIRNRTSSPTNGWFETPAFDALTGAGVGPIASKYLNFPGHLPSNATLVNTSCSNAGLVEGMNCHAIPGQGLNIGSPLISAPGTQDLGWTSATSPGIGNGLTNVADIAYYQTSSPNVSLNTQYNGRVDANVTQKDHLAFAIYWVPVYKQYFQGSARPYNLWNHNQINDAFSVIWNHTFSSTFLNEARANAAGWRYNELNENPQAPFGLPTDNVSQTGSISLNNFGGQSPAVYNQWTYSYKDVATKIVGNHSIKFGGELTRLQYLQDNVAGARPNYTFFNIWDFLNDAPEGEAGTFDRLNGVPSADRFDMRQNLWGAFVQDDWKARPNLTFNMGLRYTYFDGLTDKQNDLPNVRFGTGQALFTGMSIQLGGKAWNPQKGNLGPQFGFAWSPDYFHSKVVVRGGYGLSYNQEEIAISSSITSNPHNTISSSYTSSDPTAINPNIVYAIPGSTSTIFGYPSNPNTITGYNSANLPTAGNSGLAALPTNLHTAYTHHYSLDTQIDLGHQLVATIGYQGSSSHHLISNSNLYIYGEAQGAAFLPQINSINYFGDYAGANYNALLVSLKHNMANHFQLNADFSYSKSMDDSSSPYERDPYPYNNALARGRSDYDVGKAGKAYGVWEPVFFYGNHGWLEKVAGGWSVSGIYNFHTGFPWNPVVNGGAAYYANSGYSTFRPASYNGRAGSNFSNDAFKPGAGGYSANFAGGGGAYFTAPVYTSSSFPVPGIERNSFNGPRYMDLDATLAKSFGLPKMRVVGENAKFEIRADAFNLFNLTNLDISQISNDIGAADFGVIRGALGARTINVQARFSF